jgi:TPR repeat protein
MTAQRRDTLIDPQKLFIEAEQHEEKGDFKNAFRCFLKAAQLGDSSCQVNVGNLYADGKGVKKDFKKAAYWYKMAIKNGERCGATNLAIEYRKAHRLRAAVIWFKKAIEMSDGEACVELAKIYRNRKGGQAIAIGLLRQALLMSRRDITEYGIEEAESLLKDITAKDVKTTLHGVPR